MMMKSLRYFLLGAWEFRSEYTTNPGAYYNAYEHGREAAHCLTLRGFEKGDWKN